MPRSLVLVAVVLTQAGTLWSQEPCWSGTSDLIGPRGADRVIQKSFAGLRVCALARDLGYAQHLPPSEWPATATGVVLETQLESQLHRMRLAAGAATFERNGSDIALDSLATQWRAALMDVLNATWQLDRLRPTDTIMRSEAPATGNRSTTAQGIAASVPSELGAISRELARLKTEWKRQVSEIELLRAETGRLSRDIRVEQSSISQLQSQLASADASQRTRINSDIRRANQEIRRLDNTLRRTEMDIRSREAQLAGLNIPNRVEKLEQQVREIAGAPQIAQPEGAVRNPDVTGRVAEVDRLLAAEIERNTRELVTLRETALQRLRALITR